MRQKYPVLSRRFYESEDVVELSRQMIGKVLCTYKKGIYTSGIIAETEAYCGRNDKACHANNGLRTNRTEVMYGPGGNAYVYLCYGIHHLFNIVTNRKGLADAILVRAVEPLEGIKNMKQRRNAVEKKKPIAAGPGMVSEALGITTDDSGCDLTNGKIWIEERNIETNPKQVHCSTRIGVDYAGDDAKKEWRFFTHQFKYLQ